MDKLYPEASEMPPVAILPLGTGDVPGTLVESLVHEVLKAFLAQATIWLAYSTGAAVTAP
jgi:hypothetical protein